jgi:hypothetical protein
MAPTEIDPRIRRALGEHAVVRAADLFERGVHPRTVYGLRDAGALEQVSRGVYRLATAPPRRTSISWRSRPVHHTR